MKNRIIEIATVTLAAGKTEEDLVAASDQFQTFLSTQPGFIARTLVRKDDGLFADVVEWEDQASADTMMQAAAGSPECGAYFSVMNLADNNPATGVAHCTVLAQYQA
ncbi:antibiotic biosynthesis monooxygenase [Rhizobium sp. L1K21]|uniref:antibiotic biosynthesis monooxygenase family protein n=1 Tax=Rhizobium sp. L1K21 TaxID=2954933 RepID=UPI002093720F|nr:antibiotic biosynthesis monooxygenase [Rhizobium sp. L1K21]MCO6184826.1 antibiotic biosynthesis monooxygenase [Rhizobium sp. L1K21]